MEVNSMVEKLMLSWSGGKDSAMALRELLRDPRHHMKSLLTTITEGYDRVSMHGVRLSLLDHQAKALGLPLVKVSIQSGFHEQTLGVPKLPIDMRHRLANT
jgi:diphthamide synthase (EF-2-diphthine--ammonia ligase)